MTWEEAPEGLRAAVVRAAVARIMSRQATMTADDLQFELPKREYPWDRRGFGAVLRALVKEGRLEAIGYTPSKRGHARPVLQFRRGPNVGRPRA